MRAKAGNPTPVVLPPSFQTPITTPTVTLPTATTTCRFTRDLSIGAQGSDVACLQAYLGQSGTKHFPYYRGTGYYGGQTATAVASWQRSVGVSNPNGYFGIESRRVFGQ